MRVEMARHVFFVFYWENYKDIYQYEQILPLV